jgi:hypothetical protein
LPGNGARDLSIAPESRGAAFCIGDSMFGPWMAQLQFRGESYSAGQTYQQYGIVFVPDPYTGRSTQKEKEAMPSESP